MALTHEPRHFAPCSLGAMAITLLSCMPTATGTVTEKIRKGTPHGRLHAGGVGSYALGLMEEFTEPHLKLNVVFLLSLVFPAAGTLNPTISRSNVACAQLGLGTERVTDTHEGGKVRLKPLPKTDVC